MRFLTNFECKILSCALSIFGISNIPTHCLKETLVTGPNCPSGQFEGLEFKIRYDRLLDLFTVVPSSNPGLSL